MSLKDQSKRIDLTIVLAVKDGAEYLGNCLLSIFAIGDHIQVIVVDDGSTDETSYIAKSFLGLHKNMVFIQLPHNQGIGMARNAGLDCVKTDFVAFVDVDSVVSAGWYRAMSDYFDPTLPRSHFANFQIKNTGALASTVYFLKNKKILNGSGGSISQLGYGVDNHFGELRKTLNYKSVSFAMGNGMLFRTSLLKSIGGFNEKIKYGYDDVDVCSRIVIAGFRIIANPAAVIFHDMGHSSREKSLKQRISDVETNRIRFLLRNYSVGNLIGFFPREIKNLIRANKLRKFVLSQVYIKMILESPRIIKFRFRSFDFQGRENLFFSPLFSIFKAHAQISDYNGVHMNFDKFVPTAGYFEIETNVQGESTLWCAPRSSHNILCEDSLSVSRFSIKPAPGIEFCRLTLISEKFYFDATLKLQMNQSNTIFIPTHGKSELFIVSGGYQEPLLGGRELGVSIQAVSSIDVDFLINDTNKKTLKLREECGARLTFFQKYKASSGETKVTLMQIDNTFSTLTCLQYSESIETGIYTSHTFLPDGRLEIVVTHDFIVFMAPTIEFETGSLVIEEIKSGHDLNKKIISDYNGVHMNFDKFVPTAGYFEIETNVQGESTLWCAPRSSHNILCEDSLSVSRFSIKPAPGIEFCRLTLISEKFYFDATLKLQMNQSNTIFIPTHGKSELFIVSGGYQEPLLGGRELGVSIQAVSSIDVDFLINDTNKKTLKLREECGARLTFFQKYKASSGETKVTLMQIDNTFSTLTCLQYSESIETGIYTSHTFLPDGRLEIVVTHDFIVFMAPTIEFETGSLVIEDCD